MAAVPYYLIGTSCLPTCPVGYFTDDTNSPNVCVICSSPCSTCTATATGCLTCLAGYYMHSGTCVLNCPVGYYPSISTDSTIKGICQPCTPGCTSCVAGGLNSCTVCGTAAAVPHYLLANSTTCSITCPSGQLANPTDNTCVACSISCFTCSVLSTNCTSCKFVGTAATYLLNFACVATCPAGYYPNARADPTLSNTCDPCTPGCSSCFGAGLSSCTTCDIVAAVQYYLSGATCSSTCSTGQYALAINSTCQPCDVSCYTCTISATNCGNCNVGYAKQADGSCLAVCAAGLYNNGVSCVSCDVACATCYGPYKTTCYTCKNNGTVNFYKSTTANTCGLSCPAGQYADLPTFSCLKCHYRCAACVGSATNCSSCTTVAGINHYLLNLACLDVCPVVGYYSVATNNTCQPCAIGCKSCTSGLISSCTACQTVAGLAYYLGATDNTCYTVCLDGQFKDNVNNPNQCLKCDATCTKCSGTATNCTFCSLLGTTAVYLSSGACLSICPDGFYASTSATPTTSNLCLPCASGCAKCTGGALTNCQVCSTVDINDYYLDVAGTTCGLTCPGGQYASTPASHLCLACNTNCVQCSGTATNCTFCSKTTGMFLYQAKCYSSCPNGYYGFISSSATTSDSCQVCTPGCVTCTGAGLTTCLSCGNNGTADFYLSGTTCGVTCPDGQYAGAVTSHACLACTSPCAKCTVSATRCTFCTGTYFLSGTTCVATCPAGFYGMASSSSATSNNCVACTPGCATCTLSGLSSCSSCNNNGTVDFWKDATAAVCRTTCIAGQYQGAAGTFQCLACSVSCT